MERLPKKPFAVINADECCFFVSLFCFVLFCLFACLFVCLLAFLGVFCLFVGLFCCFVCLVWFLDLCCPLSGFVPFPNGRTPWDDPPSGPLRFIPQVVVAWRWMNSFMVAYVSVVVPEQWTWPRSFKIKGFSLAWGMWGFVGLLFV